MEQVAAQPLMSPATFLENWQGNRRLTRRIIEAFPEKELFEYSIGGMRPFAKMIMELLAIAAPGLREIITKNPESLNEELSELKTKEDLLNAWDTATEQINIYFNQLSPERFHEMHKLFGQYESPVIHSLIYAVENEIHHRGQGYVYLRSLGIEPPFYWEK